MLSDVIIFKLHNIVRVGNWRKQSVHSSLAYADAAESFSVDGS